MNKPSSLLFKLTVAALLALPATRLHADSLWKDGHSQNVCADKKAHSVGDIITIMVQENNGATRDNATTTAKKNSVDASLSSLFYNPAVSGLLTKGGTLPAMKWSTDNSFNGGGTIKNSETITAQMAVHVIDVMPNGNMVIEGNLHTAFSGEKQDAILRGTVRPDDIQANNTLFSYNIANASIQFVSKGTITDNQRKGWFSRVWDKVSPF